MTESVKYPYKTSLDLCGLGDDGAKVIYERVVSEFKMRGKLQGAEFFHQRKLTKAEMTKIKYFAKGLLWADFGER